MSSFAVSTARSMQFSSSRTLPGHVYACSMLTAGGEMRTTCLPYFMRIFARKCCASSTMSPVRAERSGIVIGKTERR